MRSACVTTTLEKLSQKAEQLLLTSASSILRIAHQMAVLGHLVEELVVALDCSSITPNSRTLHTSRSGKLLAEMYLWTSMGRFSCR